MSSTLRSGLPNCAHDAHPRRLARRRVRPRRARLVKAELSARIVRAPYRLPVVTLRSRSNFTQFGKGFLNRSVLPCARGRDTDVALHFQSQASQTQEASWDTRPTRFAGADPGGAADAGTRALARGCPRLADRASLPGFFQPRSAQRRYPARSDFIGRDHAEISRLYPRFGGRHGP